MMETSSSSLGFSGLRARFSQPGPYAWLVAALLIFGLFLFTPKTPKTACIQHVTLFNAVELHVNCDTRLLAKLYRDAPTYFTEFNNWKGRPVYFLYGVFGAPAMEAIALPLWAIVSPHATSDRKLSHYRTYFSLHLVYYLLNVVMVLGAIWMAFGIAGIGSAGWLPVTLSAAIATSDLVAGTLWLAHTTVFNLFAPIACAWFVLVGWQYRFANRLTILAWCLAGGLMVLVYPLFIILLPALFCGLALSAVTDRSLVDGYGRNWAPVDPLALAAATALFVLPLLGWNGLVHNVFQTPVYLTAEKGQFVWLIDAWREGRLGEAVPNAIYAFWTTLNANFSWFEIILPAAGLATLAFLARRRPPRLLDPALTALLIATAAVLGFNLLQGYYEARLQVSVAVLFYIAVARTGLLVDRQRVASAFLAAIALAQIVDAVLYPAITAD